MTTSSIRMSNREPTLRMSKILSYDFDLPVCSYHETPHPSLLSYCWSIESQGTPSLFTKKPATYILYESHRRAYSILSEGGNNKNKLFHTDRRPTDQDNIKPSLVLCFRWTNFLLRLVHTQYHHHDSRKFYHVVIDNTRLYLEACLWKFWLGLEDLRGEIAGAVLDTSQIESLTLAPSASR